MKKFIKINLFILLSIVMISCDKKADAVDDNGFFFNVVYQTVSTREDSTHAWTDVQGIMLVQFVQNTDDQGTFGFRYRNYKEPQFVYTTCTGGYDGNFASVVDTTASGTDSSYNVLDPYNPHGTPATTTTAPTDPNDPNAVDKIQTYQFTLTITGRSANATGCRSESDRNVELYRFTNGEVILKSEYRELKMKPVLKSEYDAILLN
jgi:hypothetical protein